MTVKHSTNQTEINKTSSTIPSVNETNKQQYISYSYR